MKRTKLYTVLNVVAHDKLLQILARILEKMALHESQVFTTSEKDHLKSILTIEDAQIQAVVDVAKEVFKDAATFGQIDRVFLLSRGVDEKVVQIIEKIWRKKGLAMAKQIEAFQAVEMPSLVLQKTDWRLHLQMGSSKRSRQSEPTAIFQLNVADMSSATKGTERLDIELSHAELHSLFLQLNSIQEEVDASPTPFAS
ncbi:unnamed protein product [Peronospora belbahrii]|uniref:COMM domain-containing protein n=1 Tax=Peronospora belbahrii TaxID=622444 RepID=A0ABN8DEZ3_9STRA|nr:unnamed protein product [Peronospora belbahrii]